ncbi:MAG: hypothetical protein AAFO07_23120 [Bacteroidota bacterium]
MKTYQSVFLLFLILFVACEKSDDTIRIELSTLTNLRGESGLSYLESLQKWNDLKDSNGKSYVYQTSFTSWAGFGSITEIRVEDGKVTSRKYQAFNYNDMTGEREVTFSYSETASKLGSNQQGTAPWTIDEWYNSCLSKYLVVDDKNNTIYFETEDNGLMTLCGFVPNNCVDDCFQGISINAFEWIN